MAQLLVKIRALYIFTAAEQKHPLRLVFGLSLMGRFGGSISPGDLRSSIREFVISLLRSNHAMFLSSLPNIHAQTTPKLQLSYIDQTIHNCFHIMHAMLLHVIYYCSHLLYREEPLR